MDQMTPPFFPNQPQDVLDLEYRLRAATNRVPQADRLKIYEVFSRTAPTLLPTDFRVENGMVIAVQDGREVAFFDPLPSVKYSHIVFGYRNWLEHKYALPGFVEVEKGDVVIDCGAFVGGFSLAAVQRAGAVHAFEPAPQNAICLRRNLQAFPQAIICQMGLFNESRQLTLNMSSSSVEHSLLTPDDGEAVSRLEIEVIRLDDYLKREGIGGIDFLKIEAEGVELEVFEGLGDLRPRKIAIDVSPEREGESPADEFKARLGALGYEMRQRGHVLFARLPKERRGWFSFLRRGAESRR